MLQPLMKSCLLVFPILKENPVILRFSSSPTFSVCLRRAMHAFSCRPDPPSPTFSALIHFDHCFRRLGALQCQRRPSLCDGVDDAGRGRAEGRSRRGDGVFDDGRAWRSMTPMHFRRAINRGCRRCRSLDNGRRPRPTRPDKISSPAAPRRRRPGNPSATTGRGPTGTTTLRTKKKGSCIERCGVVQRARIKAEDRDSGSSIEQSMYPFCR